MSGQLAKLFLRGSLMNVTAANLTEEQLQTVNVLMNTVFTDTRLDNAKHKFCQILDATIGNEYKNKEFAMAEVQITIWRTAVDVLYHNPRPKVVEDRNARIKYFKTCIMNYMRQILAENKIPTHRVERTLEGDSQMVANEAIQFYLDNTIKKIHYEFDELNDGRSRFIADINLVPVSVMKKIWALRDEIKESGVKILITDADITVIPEEVHSHTLKISEKIPVRSRSIFGICEDDDNNNYLQHCEYRARRPKEVEMDNMLLRDSVKVLSSRLPNKAQKVLQVLVNPPQDFLDTYYPKRKKEVRPKEVHIAKYLGISKNEVLKAVSLIRQQAVALDIS